MNHSSHPVVVEYAVRECFKRRTPRKAAETMMDKLAGSPNLFIGGGQETVVIDANELERQIWVRMAARAVSAASRMKPGNEQMALEATLEEYGQKVTPKNLATLQEAVVLVSNAG